MSEQIETPEVQENRKVDKSEEVVVVSKVTLNYVLIAITFLMVGILIGLFGLGDGRDNIDVTINEDQLREVLISVLEDSEINFAGGTSESGNERFCTC